MAKMFISTSFKFKVKSKQNDECVLGGDPLYRQKGINYSNVQFSKNFEEKMEKSCERRRESQWGDTLYEVAFLHFWSRVKFKSMYLFLNMSMGKNEPNFECQLYCFTKF